MVDQLEFGLELKKYRFKKQFCARRSIEAFSTVDLSPGIFQGKKHVLFLLRHHPHNKKVGNNNLFNSNYTNRVHD